MHHVEQKMPAKNQCITPPGASLSRVESEVHRAHSGQNSAVFSRFGGVLKSGRAPPEAWQYRIHESKPVHSVIVGLVPGGLDRHDLGKDIGGPDISYSAARL